MSVFAFPPNSFVLHQEIVNQFIVDLPKSIPKIIKLPAKTQTSLPTSSFGTGYITQDGLQVVKQIDLQYQIAKIDNNFMDINYLIEALSDELINYHAISSLCPTYFCRLFGYHYEEQYMILSIIMENCGSDLRTKYNNDVPFEDTSLYIGQIINILECLHTNNYVHFDLKLENLVLDNGHIKAIDAGTLTKVNNSEITKVFSRGTLSYMAPELLIRENQTKINNNNNLKSTDIYSFGITCLQMLLARRIYQRQIQLFFSRPQSYVSLTDQQIADLTDSKKSIRSVILDTILAELKTVFGIDITIEHFFSIDITKRLTIDQIKLRFNQRIITVNPPISNAPISNAPISNAPISNAPISNAPISNPQISNPNSMQIDGGSRKRKNGSRKRGSRKRKRGSRKNGSRKRG
jgi:serine/threonine protein kinase